MSAQIAVAAVQRIGETASGHVAEKRSDFKQRVCTGILGKHRATAGEAEGSDGDTYGDSPYRHADTSYESRITRPSLLKRSVRGGSIRSGARAGTGAAGTGGRSRGKSLRLKLPKAASSGGGAVSSGVRNS